VAGLFRGIDSRLVPLLLTAASMVVLPIENVVAGDLVAALIQALTWLVIGIPLWTAVWIYLSVQIGLGRLGRGELALQAYQGDRSLGLPPVGRLAFTAFWIRTHPGVALRRGDLHPESWPSHPASRRASSPACSSNRSALAGECRLYRAGAVTVLGVTS
jgi:hypothetical protein